jgi:hypothetical protein
VSAIFFTMTVNGDHLRSHMLAGLGLMFACVIGLILLQTEAMGTEPQKASGSPTSFSSSFRIEQLPKPVPQMLDTINRVGTDAGRGLSKTLNEGVNATRRSATTTQEKK